MDKLSAQSIFSSMSGAVEKHVLSPLHQKITAVWNSFTDLLVGRTQLEGNVNRSLHAYKALTYDVLSAHLQSFENDSNRDVKEVIASIQACLSKTGSKEINSHDFIGIINRGLENINKMANVAERQGVSVDRAKMITALKSLIGVVKAESMHKQIFGKAPEVRFDEHTRYQDAGWNVMEALHSMNKENVTIKKSENIDKEGSYENSVYTALHEKLSSRMLKSFLIFNPTWNSIGAKKEITRILDKVEVVSGALNEINELILDLKEDGKSADEIKVALKDKFTKAFEPIEVTKEEFADGVKSNKSLPEEIKASAEYRENKKSFDAGTWEEGTSKTFTYKPFGLDILQIGLQSVDELFSDDQIKKGLDKT